MFRQNYFKYNPLKNDYNLVNIGLDLIQNGCFIGTETVTFKKNIINDIGGFDERYRFISDYDFFIRVGLNHKIFFNKKVLSKHRVHEQNTQHYCLEKIVLTLNKVVRREFCYVI